MDNGNKIKINSPEVKLFLQEDLLPSNPDAPVRYNLVDEYAKTRKNKSSFIYIVLLSCILAVTALTVGLVFFLQDRNNSLEVDINVFDDLNLKNLLDVVTRTQSSLDAASKEKNQLELEFSTKMAQAEITRDSELQLLDSLKMDASARARESTRIRQEYESTVESLNGEYQPQIALLEAQMQDYTEQLASYDSTNVELAQKQETALNSQRQVFELEKQELIADYDKLVGDLVLELETLQKQQLETQRNTLSTLSQQHSAEMNVYDPTFTDERGTEVVSRFAHLEEDGSTTVVNPVFSASDYSLQLSDDALQRDIENILMNVSSEYSDLNYVADVISNVPWSNSLKDYVQTLTDLSNKIGDDIISASIDIFQAQDEVIREGRRALEISKSELESKEQEIQLMLSQSQTAESKIQELQTQIGIIEVESARMQEVLTVYEEIVYAFDTRARQNGDAGYILNVSDKENITVYISPLYADSVQNGTRAFVFRASGNLVGMISLYRRGNMVYALPDEGVEDSLRVNDVILLELIQ